MEERRVNDGDVKGKRSAQRDPEPVVAEQAVEGAACVRPRVEHIEELKHHQRGEGHCLCVTHVAGAFDQSAGERSIEHEQRACCHNGADKKDTFPHSPCDDAFTVRARRALHQTFVRGIDSQSERGSAVCHEIDPQDLRCEQRQDERGSFRLEANHLRQ